VPGSDAGLDDDRQTPRYPAARRPGPTTRPDDTASALISARDTAFICHALVVALLGAAGLEAAAQAGNNTRP